MKFAPKCQTLIEMEFPLYKIPMYLMIGNKTEGYKVAQTINNKNFSMIIRTNIMHLKMKFKNYLYYNILWI